MTIRAKFYCQSVTKHQHYRKRGEFLYDAVFSAVSDGSDENKRFWEATPSGSLKIDSVLPDAFEPGKSYYVDIVEAEE